VRRQQERLDPAPSISRCALAEQDTGRVARDGGLEPAIGDLEGRSASPLRHYGP